MKILKPCYALERTEENATLTLYGEIVSQRPINYDTGEPQDGDYIVQNEFLKDLETVTGAKTLTVRINSLGGSASVATMIHNRLRELARSGVALTCIVDGVAASGGSLIMCACDTVKVNPSSLIMIHNCASFLFGWYNVQELRLEADQCESWDDSQRAIYTRKTGLSDDVLRQMMEETTYLTGEEAVAKGFADELLEDAEPLVIAASADRHSLFIQGRQIHVTGCMPEYIPILEQPIKKVVKEKIIMSKEDNKPQETVPDTNAINAAIQAERQRLQEIDEIAGMFDAEIVKAAKYGATACTAQELAYRAALQQKQQGNAFLVHLQQDAQDSHVNQVTAAPPPVEDDAPTHTQRMTDGQAAMRAMFQKEVKS